MKFFVPGLPAPGGSKKTYTWRAKDGRSGTSIVDAGGQKTMNWRAAVSQAACEAMTAFPQPFCGPLFLGITFVLPRPKVHFGVNGNLKLSADAYPEKRPDATKLLRSTEDAMTHIVWADDAQVVAMEVRKIYGSPVGAEITVKSVVRAARVSYDAAWRAGKKRSGISTANSSA